MERPAVTLSYAQTIDGRIATASGMSQWIGGGESLHFAHALRAQHDAILVGAGTVCKDNPRLTVRHVQGRDPLRVVVDSTLRLPLNAAVLANRAAPGTLLATTGRAGPQRVAALRELGATVLQLPADTAGRVDLRALLETLHRQGINALMVEGGAAIITALLRERLVDRMAVCIAPRIMGAGIAAVGELGIQRLADMPALTNLAVHRYGADLILDGQLVYPEGQP